MYIEFTEYAQYTGFIRGNPLGFLGRLADAIWSDYWWVSQLKRYFRNSVGKFGTNWVFDQEPKFPRTVLSRIWLLVVERFPRIRFRRNTNSFSAILLINSVKFWRSKPTFWKRQIKSWKAPRKAKGVIHKCDCATLSIQKSGKFSIFLFQSLVKQSGKF